MARETTYLHYILEISNVASDVYSRHPVRIFFLIDVAYIYTSFIMVDDTQNWYKNMVLLAFFFSKE